MPGRRERDVPCVAVKQRATDLCLELLDLAAERGLSDVELRGRTREVQLFAENDESRQQASLRIHAPEYKSPVISISLRRPRRILSCSLPRYRATALPRYRGNIPQEGSHQTANGSRSAAGHPAYAMGELSDGGFSRVWVASSARCCLGGAGSHAVGVPLNSRAKRKIRGLEDHSDAKQRTPNTAVGTEPLRSSRRALPVASPMTDPTAIPTSTTAPMTSRRRLRAAARGLRKRGTRRLSPARWPHSIQTSEATSRPRAARRCRTPRSGLATAPSRGSQR